MGLFNLRYYVILAIFVHPFCVNTLPDELLSLPEAPSKLWKPLTGPPGQHLQEVKVPFETLAEGPTRPSHFVKST